MDRLLSVLPRLNEALGGRELTATLVDDLRSAFNAVAMCTEPGAVSPGHRRALLRRAGLPPPLAAAAALLPPPTCASVRICRRARFACCLSADIRLYSCCAACCRQLEQAGQLLCQQDSWLQAQLLPARGQAQEDAYSRTLVALQALHSTLRMAAFLCMAEPEERAAAALLRACRLLTGAGRLAVLGSGGQLSGLRVPLIMASSYAAGAAADLLTEAGSPASLLEAVGTAFEFAPVDTAEWLYLLTAGVFGFCMGAPQLISGGIFSQGKWALRHSRWQLDSVGSATFQLDDTTWQPSGGAFVLSSPPPAPRRHPSQADVLPRLGLPASEAAELQQSAICCGAARPPAAALGSAAG